MGSIFRILDTPPESLGNISKKHKMGKKTIFLKFPRVLGPKSNMATSFCPKITKLHFWEKTNKIIIFVTRHSQNRIFSTTFLKKELEIWMSRSEVTACLWSKKVIFGHFFNFREGPTWKPVKKSENPQKVPFSTFVCRFRKNKKKFFWKGGNTSVSIFGYK